MSTLKVDAIRHNSATSDAITTASDGTCTAKLTSIGGGQLSHRNLVINGAMTVAQRGQSSTTAGYQTVDRWRNQFGGTEENNTQAQSSLSSSDTPFSFGFRKSFKVTNGNQTGGADANNLVYIRHHIEDQNMANSGWNYTSSSSFITLSFWVRASVAQDYHFHLRTMGNPVQLYPMEMTLAANTWTKITKTIPGNSNIVFDNDNTDGMHLNFNLYCGTDYTSSSANNDQWQAYSGSIFGGKDQTTTWYTTNDATFEITGVQLEVGDTATSFEHRSFGEELSRCQRYCYVIPYGGNSFNTRFIDNVYCDTKSSSEIQAQVTFPVPMRDTPSYTGSSTNIELFAGNGSDYFTVDGFSNYLTYGGENCHSMSLRKSGASSITEGQGGKLLWRATGGFMKFDAEL